MALHGAVMLLAPQGGIMEVGPISPCLARQAVLEEHA
eukprot:CAMPEP_0115210218 /NCGR_PEP_ID=MMETSP0270-20121206/22134_1 /TAXON_ID=71861 /ORGANISM="Scrippsiella trochoidea, Strain CCMP3099" /LENGTH=36 /DNA_ID= /DNA_START= /DNA_END= /DNA_ORIENTATION=